MSRSTSPRPSSSSAATSQLLSCFCCDGTFQRPASFAVHLLFTHLDCFKPEDEAKVLEVGEIIRLRREARDREDERARQEEAIFKDALGEVKDEKEEVKDEEDEIKDEEEEIKEEETKLKIEAKFDAFVGSKNEEVEVVEDCEEPPHKKPKRELEKENKRPAVKACKRGAKNKEPPRSALEDTGKVEKGPGQIPDGRKRRPRGGKLCKNEEPTAKEVLEGNEGRSILKRGKDLRQKKKVINEEIEDEDEEPSGQEDKDESKPSLRKPDPRPLEERQSEYRKWLKGYDGPSDSCHMCHKNFTTSKQPRDSMVHHVKIVHFRTLEAQCPHCKKVFQTQQNRDSHVRNMHQNKEKLP